MKRIDDFSDPPSCDPSSGLLWSKPHNPLYDVFSDASTPPYIVLMERHQAWEELGQVRSFGLGGMYRSGD